LIIGFGGEDMKENVLKTKSFDFSLRIVKLHQYMKEEKKEYVMSKQLLRSGTAIGALVREAEHAESRADFIHKLSISLKEANESEYWMELLFKGGYMDKLSYDSMNHDLSELLRLLVAIVKKAKSN
jgi:four helix bundle protein